MLGKINLSETREFCITSLNSYIYDREFFNVNVCADHNFHNYISFYIFHFEYLYCLFNKLNILLKISFENFLKYLVNFQKLFSLFSKVCSIKQISYCVKVSVFYVDSKLLDIYTLPLNMRFYRISYHKILSKN